MNEVQEFDKNDKTQTEILKLDVCRGYPEANVLSTAIVVGVAFALCLEVGSNKCTLYEYKVITDTSNSKVRFTFCAKFNDLEINTLINPSRPTPVVPKKIATAYREYRESLKTL